MSPQEQQELKLLERLYPPALNWWNSLSGQDRLFKLISFTNAYGIEIDYPTESQIIFFHLAHLKSLEE